MEIITEIVIDLLAENIDIVIKEEYNSSVGHWWNYMFDIFYVLNNDKLYKNQNDNWLFDNVFEKIKSKITNDDRQYSEIYKEKLNSFFDSLKRRDNIKDNRNYKARYPKYSKKRCLDEISPYLIGKIRGEEDIKRTIDKCYEFGYFEEIYCVQLVSYLYLIGNFEKGKFLQEKYIKNPKYLIHLLKAELIEKVLQGINVEISLQILKIHTLRSDYLIFLDNYELALGLTGFNPYELYPFTC